MATRRSRRPALGPGTILAMLAAAGFVVYRASASPPELPLVAQHAPAVKPLWKPEPAWAIARASALGLTEAQTAELRSLQSLWEAEKRARLAEMARSTSSVGSRGRRTLDQLQGDLSDYVALSRSYDVARTGYWLRAKSVLTQRQLRQGGLL